MDGPSLKCGRLALGLAPAIGGSIARFDWIDGDGRVEILRGSESDDAGVLGMASFPLVPFVNRIRGGRFNFRSREVDLAPNMAGDTSPLHGQGWLSAWQVEESDEISATLRFQHDPGEWPWAYLASQRYELDARGLTLALTCRNLSDEPMPCGLGQHPYFPCSAETRIDTRVTDVWTIDAQVLPVAKIPAAGRFNLTDRRVCGQDLDHGFAGWSGRARLNDPGRPFEIVLSSPEARFFQLYSPRSGDLCVAEPVTHANAALNAPEVEWPGLGLRVLEPGEEMRLNMRIEVRAV